MKHKRGAALLLAGAAVFSLTLGGCGSATDSDAVAATCGDQELTLGYLNFVAHYYQITYDSILSYYYGDDHWTGEAVTEEDGTTMEDSVKAGVLGEVELDCLLDQHKAEYGVEITDEETEAMQAAGDALMADNTEEAIEAMGATSEYVAQMLYYDTVAQRMEEAIESEVGNDLDIADYARRTFSYIRIDTAGYTDEDSNYVEYSAAEQAALKNEADLIAQDAKDDFEAAADDNDYLVYTYSYGEDEASEEDGGFSDAVIKEADRLNEGEVSGVIDGGDYYYIIRLDSEDDQDSAEAAMESASLEIKSDYFSEVTDGFLEESDFTVDEDLWAKVRFTYLFTTEEE